MENRDDIRSGVKKIEELNWFAAEGATRDGINEFHTRCCESGKIPAECGCNLALLVAASMGEPVENLKYYPENVTYMSLELIYNTYKNRCLRERH